MRDKFKGYYKPTKDEEDFLWGRALIVMDANVVLDLYRFHSSTTRLYLDSLSKFANRLWLPYQIALEFHRNRPKVRAESPKAHQVRIKELDAFKNTISSKAYKSKLTSSKAQDALVAGIQAAIDELKSEFEAIRIDSFPNTDDPILTKVSMLFEGRVGEKPTHQAHEELLKEGKNRFDQSIPPGYEDRGNKPSGEEYGDYFLWQQLMDHAKTSDHDVIFATEDAKPDWTWKVNGDTIGPRPELIQEFREKTGRDIIFYSGKEFFRQLTDRAETADKSGFEEALADVSAVSDERDENSFDALVDLLKMRDRSARMNWSESARQRVPEWQLQYEPGSSTSMDSLHRRYHHLARRHDDTLKEIELLQERKSTTASSNDRLMDLHGRLEIVSAQLRSIRKHIRTREEEQFRGTTSN